MKPAIVAAVILLALPLVAQVKVVENPTFVVDATNTARGLVRLRNDGSAAQKVGLAVTEFKTATGMTLDAPRKLAKAGETPAASFLSFAIAPGATETVIIEVSNLWQAGYSSAMLRDGERDLATLQAVKNRVPFNVAPAGWKADAPFVLPVRANDMVSMTLANSDELTYSVRWRFFEAGVDEKSGSFLIPPNGQRLELGVGPSNGGWLHWFESLFKVGESDATLILEAAPNATTKEVWMQRAFPVKLQRTLLPPTLRSGLSMFLLFVLLLLGAITSLVLSYWIPNRIRRLRVGKRIEDCGGAIRNLTTTISSVLRVGMRVEKTRLLERLRAAWALSPDFAAMASEQDARAAILEREAAVLERIDRAYQRTDEQWPTNNGIGPTMLRRACGLLSEAQKALEVMVVNDPQLRVAEEKTTEAERLVSGAQMLDDVFRASLATRVQQFVDSMTGQGAFAGNANLKHFLDEIIDLNPGLTAANATGANIVQGNYCSIDRATAKLEIIHDFLSAYEKLDQTQRQKHRDMLLRLSEALRMPSFEEFRRAERIAAEIRERVYSSEVAEHLATKRAHVSWEPPHPKVNEVVHFSVEFDHPGVNASTARRCFTYRWNFGDGLREERGWAVAHYFREAKAFPVTVTFVDDAGQPVMDNAGKPVTLSETLSVASESTSRFGERTKIEFVQLAVVLVVAIIGLLSGASEQLQKVDLIPGLIAVFVLGFSAEQIKKVLTGRTIE